MSNKIKTFGPDTNAQVFIVFFMLSFMSENKRCCVAQDVLWSARLLSLIVLASLHRHCPLDGNGELEQAIDFRRFAFLPFRSSKSFEMYLYILQVRI